MTDTAMVISISRMPSETGGQEVCTKKTSSSRTLSSICTSMFWFEKRTSLDCPSGNPSSAHNRRENSGWAEPEKTLMFPCMAPKPSHTAGGATIKCRQTPRGDVCRAATRGAAGRGSWRTSSHMMRCAAPAIPEFLTSK